MLYPKEGIFEYIWCVTHELISKKTNIQCHFQ